MTKMINDVVEVGTHRSLDALIEALQQVRAALPEGATDIEVKMRGDDVFGRRLSVFLRRPQTAEEAACDARYATASLHLAA
jgi:LPS sulfotransferase NodH